MNKVAQKKRVQLIRQQLSLVLEMLKPYLSNKNKEENLESMTEINVILLDEILTRLQPRIMLLRNNPRANGEQIEDFDWDYSLLTSQCFLILEEYEKHQEK